MNRELAVLSALLKDEDLNALAQYDADRLFVSHNDVYTWVMQYYQKNHQFPPKSLIEKEFGVMLTDDIGTTSYHIEQLRDLWMRNKAREILHETATRLQDNQLVDAINGLISGTNDLKRTTADIRDLDVIDVEDAVEHLRLVKELNDRGDYGVKVGIPGIDDMLPSGIVPGMLGLILGYPARGKSWLSALMAVNAWDRGKRVLYVSLEMMESDVRARIYAIAGKGQWKLRDLQRGDVDLAEFEDWATERFARRKEFPVISNNGGGPFTPTLLRAKIEQYRPDIVFIDYIQLMSPDAKAEGDTVRLKALSTELKQAAMASATPIIGVVSATPADATDMDGIPELGQVAWSKQLAYDSDFVLAVGRPDNSPIMGIAFRKNRSGPLMDFALECDFNKGIFNYNELDFESV